MGIPDSARNFLLIALLLFTLFPVAAQNNPALQDSWLLSLSKPLVGTLFAVLIEGSRIVIVGSILKSQVGGSDKDKEALDNGRQTVPCEVSPRWCTWQMHVRCMHLAKAAASAGCVWIDPLCCVCCLIEVATNP